MPQVFLRVGTMRGPLHVLRDPLPRFIRFVIQGTHWPTLDVLDQIGDEPKPNEHVIAAVKVDESVVHFDGTRNGKRCGWNEHSATYEPVPEQPPQDTLRNAALWREWAMSHFTQEVS